MNGSNGEKITSFLKKFPKNKIVEILNTIDNKIVSLHEISSKDFLFFNKLLKEYYSRVKVIAEANNEINSFFRKDLNSFLNYSKENNNEKEQYINNIDDYIALLLDKLSKVYSSFDLLIVPFNNFKQNLITLKYILANINLHLTYVELTNKDDLKKQVNKLYKAIQNAASNNIVASENSENLVTDILHIKSNACILRSKNNTEITENIKKLAIEHKKLDKEEYWPENFLHRINTHSQNCFANMGEIITNLQYHDIIRQKMEHIQTSQKNLISELKNIDNKSDENETHLKLIFSIPEITEIQVAQLLYTNKDYQTSIEKISSRLIEVGREMKELNSLYINLSANAETFQTLFSKQLEQTTNAFKVYKDDLDKNWRHTSKKLINIIEQYKALKATFNNIFTEEKLIRTEIKKFESLIKENGKDFSADLIKKLVFLISDLKLNSNSLKNSLNNITTNVNSLESISDEINHQLNKKRLKQETLTDLSAKINTVKNTTILHSKTSLDIANEITNAIKNIEYYNFFENTVEEIVTKLNQINEQINYEEIKNELGNNNEILLNLKGLYTMKSERDIHNKLTENGFNLGDLFDDKNNVSQIDDGEIELF